MKKGLFFISVFIIALIYAGCKDDSTGPDSKSYNVKYKVTSTGNVSSVSYLAQNGDTLTDNSVGASWDYSWSAKGKTGDKTYLKVTMQNSIGVSILQILADDAVIVRDSVQGVAAGTVSISRGTTLP